MRPWGGAVEIAFHDQVRLVNFLDGVGLFADGNGEGTDAHGAAAELDDDGLEDALVHFVEAVLINLQHGEGAASRLERDAPIGLHLRIVADA